jgi:ribosomal RNA-processing protein 12
VGQKLYPLVVQRVVQLAKPDDVSGSTSVGEAVMPELTKLFRTHPPHSGEYILTSMEVVLQPVYRPTWSVSLLPLAVILQSSPNADVISQLLRLQTLMPQPIQEAVGSIIQGVGLEEFWNYVSWNDDKKQGVISPQQAWILPLLKSSGTVSAIRPNMAFFQGRVLGVARQCDAYATTNPSPANKSRVVDIWSLLTCCCCSGASQDFAKEFPALAPILVRAMGDERYPQLVTVICGALQILVQSIQLSEDENDHRVLSETSTKLLPALFKLVETLKGTSTAPSSKNADSIDEMEDGESESKNATPEDQRVQSVISAIAELARVAPKPFLQGLLKKVLQRLLAVTQSDNTESNKICTLLGLCQALISALDEASVEWVYRAVKPLIRSDEHPARVQKRAYKVMLEICQKHNDFVVDDNHWKELTELLVGSIMTCQVSARHMRLKCMAMIVTGFDASNKQQMDIIPKVVGEVLLCLKDSNGKTREAAYQLLLSLSVAMSDMTKYFTVIAAALGAETPHMRSAAVMAMSRLVFEYAREDDVVHGMLPMMLQTVLVLFDENSREVVKSVIGFVRVSVAAMTKDQLEPLLPSVTDGLLKYHRGKGRFRAKIKIIIKKLVRIYGYDKLMPLVPESDTRLLTHMRKLSERAARRKAAQHPEGKGESNDFEQMMESDEDDSDDGRTLMTGATRFTELTGRSSKSVRSATAARSEMKNVRSKAASTIASSRTLSEGPRLKDDRDGEVLDMLDPSMSKSVRFAIDEESDDDSDGGIMEFDDLGRLIVRDDLGENKAHVAHREEEVEGEDDENLEIRGVKKRKLTKFESAKIARDEAQKKRNKKTVQALGAAYKSKKSGGDVKKKGQKFEPYAFVPLDAKSYTKKNRRKAVDSMATVVRTGGKRKRN